VRRVLEAYARRGVFRSFSQTSSGSRQTEFRFHWLWNLPFHLAFDAGRGALSFRKLLPHIPAGSDVDAGLRAFLKSCSSPDRPEHRRIDPARVAVRYSNRRGAATLTFQAVGNDFEYAVKKAINLVNEIFLGFLNADHPDYMARHFSIPED